MSSHYLIQWMIYDSCAMLALYVSIKFLLTILLIVSLEVYLKWILNQIILIFIKEIIFQTVQALWCKMVVFTAFYLYGSHINKAHGANMGPTLVLSAPDEPHVGPMNLAIRVVKIWENATIIDILDFD